MTKKTVGNALPFANTMGDSMDLMRRMWGMAGLPGIPNPANLASMAMRLPQQLPNMVAPTFDINELDKRIADLRAVEQWLELNASMLRTTIQTLEVQRATISTLKGISGAMLAPLTKGGQKTEGLPAGAAPFAAPPNPLPEMQAPPAKKAGHKRHKSKAAHPPTVADAPLNPQAWWNTLQDQFTKIAATAAAAGAAPPAKQPGKAPAKRPAKKARSG
jgi:hypothetical protein